MAEEATQKPTTKVAVKTLGFFNGIGDWTEGAVDEITQTEEWQEFRSSKAFAPTVGIGGGLALLGIGKVFSGMPLIGGFINGVTRFIGGLMALGGVVLGAINFFSSDKEEGEERSEKKSRRTARGEERELDDIEEFAQDRADFFDNVKAEETEQSVSDDPEATQTTTEKAAVPAATAATPAIPLLIQQAYQNYTDLPVHTEPLPEYGNIDDPLSGLPDQARELLFSNTTGEQTFAYNNMLMRSPIMADLQDQVLEAAKDHKETIKTALRDAVTEGVLDIEDVPDLTTMESAKEMRAALTKLNNTIAKKAEELDVSPVELPDLYSSENTFASGKKYTAYMAEGRGGNVVAEILDEHGRHMASTTYNHNGHIIGMEFSGYFTQNREAISVRIENNTTRFTDENGQEVTLNLNNKDWVTDMRVGNTNYEFDGKAPKTITTYNDNNQPETVTQFYSDDKDRALFPESHTHYNYVYNFDTDTDELLSSRETTLFHATNRPDNETFRNADGSTLATIRYANSKELTPAEHINDIIVTPREAEITFEHNNKEYSGKLLLQNDGRVSVEVHGEDGTVEKTSLALTPEALDKALEASKTPNTEPELKKDDTSMTLPEELENDLANITLGNTEGEELGDLHPGTGSNGNPKEREQKEK